MTDELFRNDATLSSCEATVVAADGDGIELDRTVFYPQGGGQAGDAGVLRRADGREVSIVDTRKRRDAPGRIVHLLADGGAVGAVPLQPGDRVIASIDVARRLSHMRFHTATHLLCAVVRELVDGCSITADYARLDFAMTALLDKATVQHGLDELVARGLPVGCEWISDDELRANPQLVKSMSVSPPIGFGRVRLVRIADADLQPCGGTHVRNTAEIGAMRVAKIEKKSARTRRVVLEFA